MKAPVKILNKLRLASALLLQFGALSSHSAVAGPDILYVGDQGANNDTSIVRRFNGDTGTYLPGGISTGVFVAPNANGLNGPRGILVTGGKLALVNQNVDQPFPGEVLMYKLNNGAFEKKLVPASDPNAPFTARGMVSWKGVIYVADFNKSDDLSDTGRLLAFDQKRGTFLADFTPPSEFAYPFHPRGLVIGSNGLLYVSNTPTFPPAAGGQVLVFDPGTFDFIGAFISDPGGVGQLNRPEGLVFGPDGNLYITSFRGDPTDNDTIRIYDGSTGVYVGKIDLDLPGQPRAFAQALLFGPAGKLFVPITGNAPTTQGQVRRYNVATKTFDVFVAAGGVLGQPWYLTFEKTDPGTLAYDEHGDELHRGDRD